ncbi:hypothetical protein [Bordetella bronchiseptica]|nr:hypothetical protein [Bordetella bronchiseptica]
MIERPLFFNGPMVRAILAGTKTQTRRGKGLEYFSRPENDPEGWLCARVAEGHAFMAYKHMPHERAVKCPYGQPGDRLWVRETWAYGIHAMAAYRDEDGPFVYAAGGTTQGRLGDRWRPSIHMPRSACRLVLEITGVRVERLQDISEADAMAEGCSPAWLDAGGNTTVHTEAPPTYRQGFARLWREINGDGAWPANPWVWVVEFTAQALGNRPQKEPACL